MAVERNLRTLFGPLLAAALLAWLAGTAAAADVSLVMVRSGTPARGVTVRLGDRQGITDARGRIRFENVAAGSYPVSVVFPAAAPGHFGGTQKVCDLQVQGAVLLKRCELPRALSVHGYVVDLSKDAPLAGAKVTLTLRSGETVAEATTGEEGAYRFDGLAPGIARLSATADGFRNATEFVALEQPIPHEIDLLPPGAQPCPVYRIRVLASDRSVVATAKATTAGGETLTVDESEPGFIRIPPLSGPPLASKLARLTVSTSDGRKSTTTDVPTGLLAVRPLGPALKGRVQTTNGDPVAGIAVIARRRNETRAAMARSDGTFTIPDLAPGAWTLDAISFQLRPRAPVDCAVAEDAPPAVVTVEPTAMVAGRVTGLPKGATARVTCGDQETETRPDGTFRLECLRAANRFTITAHAAGFLPKSVVFGAAGQKRAEIALDAAGSVHGRVVDESGKPVSGAMVFLLTGTGRNQARVMQRTGADGGFGFAGLVPGIDIRLWARAQGKAPALLVPPPVSAGKTALDPMVLKEPVTVTGFVKDEKGKPVKGVVVTAAPAAAGSSFFGSRSEPTAADGSFTVTGIAPGKTLLNVSELGGGAAHYEGTAFSVTAPAEGVVLTAKLLRLADLAKGEGIAWQSGVKQTLARARLENRPVFVEINALDEETGNRTMAEIRLRDPSLVRATRPFLCLVASPSDHGPGPVCSRFGTIPCSAHKEVLNWALLRFSGNGSDLVSPQHIILAPDGTVLWRQPYWIEAKDLERELEKALVKVSPRRALDLAEQTRRHEMESLETGGDAAAYMKSGDPLAPAVLLLLYDKTNDSKWLEPLKAAPPQAFGLLRLYLQDDKSLVEVAKAVDAKRGAWWERYWTSKPAAAPEPCDPVLKKAFERFRKDRARDALGTLLDALSDPVDGPEVRAALAPLAGGDLGFDPDTWREALER